jgi:hypothetical protein
MIKESTTKLLGSIARVQGFQNGSGNAGSFRATLIELRDELASYQTELKEILAIQSTLSSKATDELLSLLSKSTSVCDNIVFLTEFNPNSDPKALVMRLNDEGGLSDVETLLKAYFPK